MYKVIVLGAGPAGCSAAYHLAKSGHRVILVDKEKFPRDKACGDGISVQSVQALSTMGIYPPDIKKLATEFSVINKLALGKSNGNSYEMDFPLDGYCIPRTVFDNLLYERAINAGCTPLTKAVSNINLYRQDIYDFDYVIDARGVYSGEANAIAIRTYWTLKLEDFFTHSASKIHIYFDKYLGANGYCWIFPVDVKDGLVKLNVGIGIFKDESYRRKKNIIRLFEEFIQYNRILKILSSKAITRQDTKSYPLATAKRYNQVSQGNILKIGDAANLTDPLTGEGIANAILSGIYVTQAINMSNSVEAVATNWQRLYELRFQPHLHAGLQIRLLKKYSFMNDWLIAFMNYNKHFGERVGYAITGLIPYNEFFFF